MGNLHPVPCSSRLIGPRSCLEIQRCLFEVRKIQLNRQFGDLKNVDLRFRNLTSILENSGLDGAAILCRHLSRLSEELLHKPSDIDSSRGIETLSESTSQLAKFIFMVSARIPVSPLMLVDAITSIQHLFNIDRITRFDLFKPHAAPLNHIDKPLYIEPFRHSEVIDEAFHLRFRKILSCYLKEQRPQYLDEIVTMFDRVRKIDGSDQVSRLACLVSSCVEFTRLEPEKFGAGKTLGTLLARVDVLIRQICRNHISNRPIVLPETLLCRMLFLIGDARYGASRTDCACPQGIGPDTERICEMLNLESWFDDDPDRVMQAECEKSIQLADELSEMNKEGDYRSLQNSLALFFLGGLDSGKTSEMFAKLDELKNVASRHADGVFRTYLVFLCKALSDSDGNLKEFPESREDEKIASAWMMAWDFIENPVPLTDEKILCLGQRIAELGRGTVESNRCLAGFSESRRNIKHARPPEEGHFPHADVNFMRPWPYAECTRAGDALVTEIIRELSAVTDTLTETYRLGVAGPRLEELHSAVKRVDSLSALSGEPSVMVLARHAGSLINRAMNANGHADAPVEALFSIIDSIRKEAVFMAEDTDTLQEPGSRFARVRDLIEEYPAGRRACLEPESKTDFDPVHGQLQVIESGLRRWEGDLADREIAIGIREGFSRLAILLENDERTDMSRICDVVTPMISKENLKTTSDSLVIHCLLLEVHQAIEAALDDSGQSAQKHLGSMLSMVEKL